MTAIAETTLFFLIGFLSSSLGLCVGYTRAPARPPNAVRKRSRGNYHACALHLVT